MQQQQQQQSDHFVCDGHQPAYFIYLLISDWYESSSLIEPLRTAFLNFGKRLGDRARVIAPIEGSYEKTRSQILNLDWPESVGAVLGDQIAPFILITDINLSEKEFHPKKDPHLIFYCDEVINNIPKFIAFLKKFEILIKENKDVCHWSGDFYQKKAKSNSFFRILFDSLIFQPTIAGIGIDLKKVFQTLPDKK